MAQKGILRYDLNNDKT